MGVKAHMDPCFTVISGCLIALAALITVCSVVRVLKYPQLVNVVIKFSVFWDVLPFSQVDVDRRFRGAYCLHHQGDEWASRGPHIYHRSTSSSIITHSPFGSPVHLDSYITCYPFARGSLIALMMEAVLSSETSVIIYLTTRQYIPEDSKLHTRRRENLKSQNVAIICLVYSKLERHVY
jgi:hypothetical protein